MKAYWSSVEYKYKELLKRKKYKGGFVYVFVAAQDARDALAKIIQGVERNNLEVTNVEFVSIYEDIPWETKKEAERYNEFAKQAIASGQVIFDDFYAYEDD